MEDAEDENFKIKQKDMNEADVGRHLLAVRGETIRSTELGWRNIVFLPFNPFWLLIITTVTIYLIFIDNYSFLYGNPINDIAHTSFTVAWVILVIDLLFSILHRVWDRVNRSRRFHPKSWWIILIDVICAHPVVFLYSNVFNRDTLPHYVLMFVLTVDFLRLYRVFVYYDYLRSMMGLNLLLIHILFYNIFVILFADLFSIVWYLVEKSYGTTTLFMFYETLKSKYFSLHLVLIKLFFGSSINIFYPASSLDALLTLIPIIFGFCLQMIYIIVLFVVQLKQLDHHFSYKSFLEVRKNYLINIGVKKSIRNDFLNFYYALWDLWWGIPWEESLDKLPLSLRKEVLLDLSWDAIQHSRALRFQGLNFKRDLALRMSRVMSRPGDFILNYGDIKNTMFYIVSGHLQIMSHHDSTIPLISFASGSILGGNSIILPNKCKLTIRSLYYSEMITLSTSQLFEVALSYPWEAHHLLFRAFDRLQESYTMTHFINLFNQRYKMYKDIYMQPEINTIAWVKKRWKLINSYDVATYEEAKDIIKEIPIYEQFTSKYLDLYVISEDLELKKNRFCLEANWPFVIDPECDFLIFWNRFIIALAVYDSIIVPYYAVFCYEMTLFSLHTTAFTQLMYVVDTYLHLITAVKSRSVVIMSSKKIFNYKIKKIGFYIDLLSSLPIGILVWISGGSNRTYTYWTLLRLLKTCRVLKLLIEMESGKTSLALMYWIRHIIVYMFLIYWSSCIMFFISCPNINSKCVENGWVEEGKLKFAREHNGEEYLCFNDYLTISIFYTMSVTGVTDSSNINTNSSYEAVAIVVLTLIIGSYTLYFTAHVMSIELLSASLRIAFINLMKNLKKFALVRKFPLKLTNSIIEYINLQWERDKANEFVLERDLFYDAPQKLYAELTNYFKGVLENYKIFGDKTEETKQMISKLAKKARIIVLPEKFSICKAGHRATCLTIVRKGYCRLISHLESDIAKFPNGKLVGAGSIFPLSEIIFRINTVITVYTVTHCECIVIDERDFIFAWNTNRSLSKRFESSERSLSLKNKFHLAYNTQFRPNEPTKSNPSFVIRNPFFCTKKNLLKMILHVLFPKYCFTPSGKFMFYWELTRFFLVPISVIYFTLFFIVIEPYYPNIGYVISTVFDCLSILDIYFRFNTGYYNKEGIFIKDVCNIVHRYFTTAFLADFCGAFPWVYLINIIGNVDLPWVVLTIFKVIPMYRFIRFSQILAKREKCVLFLNIYTVIIVFTILLILISCHSLLFKCFVAYSTDTFKSIHCKSTLIFGDKHNFNSKEIIDALLLTLGSHIGKLLKMRSYINQAGNVKEMRFSIFCGFVFNILIILFIAKCCKWAFTGSKDYILFKQNVNALSKYLKNNVFSVKDIKTCQNYFKHLWDNIMPNDIANVIRKIHPSLRISIVSHLYFNKLRQVSFLENVDDYILKAISFEINEMYVTKGLEIVDEYDVSTTVYIILEGSVVVSLSKISPAILGPGCIFGALQLAGTIKHIYTYEAAKNSTLLKISSKRLHETLSEFPEVYNKFLSLCLPTKEYLITGKLMPIVDSFIDLTKQDQSGRTTSSRRYLLTYIVITYLVAYCTVILICLVYIFTDVNQNIFIYCFLVLDIITLWKIITQMTLPYTDAKTGLMVTQKDLIRKKYIKTKDFYIDVITLFPYIGFKLLLMVKLLRILELIPRKSERKTLSFIRNWEVWAFHFVIILFVLFLGSVLWALVFGYETNIFSFNGVRFTIRKPIYHFENLIHSALFVVILFCRTGRVVSCTFPDNKQILIVSSCLTAFSLVLLAVFLGQVSQHVQKISWKRRIYENKMIKQRMYLKHRRCSPSIVESVWEYFELLWQNSNGENLPSALNLLPIPLNKKIMYELFGSHLESSYLFKRIHLEFIKNLCMRVELTNFFPGESIVFEGDVDGTMYFIHNGEVDVLKTTGHDEEKLVGILTVGETFGFCQGLYECRPHPTSYKARTTCEILSLKLDHWKDLMLFYSAQTRIVYRRAAALAYEYYWDNNTHDK